MSANLEPAPSASIPTPAYTVTMSGGREVVLRRLRSGGCRLVLQAPAKQSERMIVHGQLEFSEQRSVETLMALGAICTRVDLEGLPS